MEKTNKYYGIIENLVKSHKKFTGLESILDEIIDDVYSHSEVIINSITNDSVINAYLEKVVSTSIITVPKRLKFTANTSVSPRVEIKEIQRANTELVDKMINSALEEDVSTIEEISLSEEDLAENVDADELLEALEVQVEEPVEEPTEVVINEVAEEPVEELTDVVVEEVIDESVEELNDIVIDEIVDEPVEELDDVVVEEAIEEPVPELSIEPEEANEDIVLEVEEFSLEEENEPLELAEAVEAVEEIEETDELVNDEELSPVLDIEENIIDDSVNEVEEIETFEELPEEEPLLAIDAEEVEEAEEQFELEDFSLQDDVSELTTLEDTLEEFEENINPIEDLTGEAIEDVTETETFETIDYSAFEFTPENVIDEFDTDEIAESIKQINSKRPELKIASIFNLKYKQNHSVEEISEELEMSKDKVLEALSEIIATV